MAEKQPLQEGVGVPQPGYPAVPPPYAAGPPPQPDQPPYQGQQPYPPQPAGPYQGQPGVVPPPEYKQDMQPGQPPVAVPPGTTTVIVQQQRFSQFPATCVCPNCHQNVVTTTVAETSLLTWLICGAIILFGGWICCLCLIPFCIDDLKDIRHVCPSCRHTIHVFKRM
uniref:Lipopolysaccharide-induced tumor necrosis factor-alpha factor homolog n=1 Tax=Phallusia mammillata TaxID=59560 RepID=A0A6F9DIZ7_9ASCI|nr:lipopolysaccharide-induced tumor necrosis factor-alpha factor homolog [Phallusia mammillata]